MTPPPPEQFAARVFMGPVLRAQPDRRLVDLVRDGYDAAFEEIVRRYRRPLDRFAAAIVGGRSEDVTQDAFSKALMALRGSEAEIELRPWLYRIVRNTALNDLRDRAPATAELTEALPGARSAAAEVEAREELRELMERLRALPETQRAALVMRELEGLSHEEIAAALGVSGGAARQAIFRARAALREGFGLLVPWPVLRALADHGGEAGAAGGAVALGGGAVKAGMATVLVVGAVGAGVAVDHHRGHRTAPETAAAAPLAGGRHLGTGGSTRPATEQSALPDDHSRDRGSAPGDDSSGRGSSGDGDSALGDGDRSGSGESRSAGEGSHSGGSGHSGSGSGGPGPSSTSGAGDRHGGRSDDDGGDDSRSGSGSGDSGSGGSGSDDGGTSGGSGSDDGFTSGGDSGSSGPGGGEIESEPIAGAEPTLSEDNSGSGGSDSGGGSDDSSGTSGGGDLSGSYDTSGSDASP
ncbi:MAG TPA: RNA polymerase sigma factor [Solirubrobacterales bacterium]|nr:RNA polymerase sigma factor [Solirubrobacterales bacterium]